MSDSSMLVRGGRVVDPESGLDDFADVLIRDGTVYDGTGAPAQRVDIAIRGDRIVRIGHLAEIHARQVVDANGLAVAISFLRSVPPLTRPQLNFTPVF